MNKKEIVATMAKKTGLTMKDCETALSSFMQSVEDALKSGDKVLLTGFGTFKVRERAARVGKNPRTGEPVNVAASRTPDFKAGKTLKDALK